LLWSNDRLGDAGALRTGSEPYASSATISCAIVDVGGHMILPKRMDGGRFHTLHSCTTMAVCAASNRRRPRRRDIETVQASEERIVQLAAQAVG
jgi:uncharacterized protein GlcG (DUF336 family)